MVREAKGDYAIEIEFERGTERPAAVFRSLSDLIEAFQQFDTHLAHSVTAEIEAKVVLQEVEAGSVRAWLSTLLKSVDDTALKKLDWRQIVGTYLLRGKQRVVSFLDKSSKEVTKESIARLETDLLALAQNTNVRHIAAYQPIPTRSLLTDLSQVSSALQVLPPQQRALLVIASHAPQALNREFLIPGESIDELLTAESLSSTAEMILRVKRPDYLGTAMWEFRHQNRQIFAKIADVSWLQQFQNRSVKAPPGSSLRAVVSTQVHYDQFGEVVAMHYTIMKVLGVVEPPAWAQVDLYGGDKEE